MTRFTQLGRERVGVGAFAPSRSDSSALRSSFPEASFPEASFPEAS